MRASGRIIAREELTPQQRDEMFALMTEYYENLNRLQFESDLLEKQWIILLVDSQQGRLQGFSTQRIIETSVNGEPVRALFSGDTIVAADFRGYNPLAGLWGRLALALIDCYPDAPLYWYLISKGYKTYRYLPVFFREFYPRSGVAFPAAEYQVREALSLAKYPDRYNPRLGIIETEAEHACRLRCGVADVDELRLQDPHVRFFCEQNPRHAEGVELCCLAALTPSNFTPAAWKVIQATSPAAFSPAVERALDISSTPVSL